MPKEERGFSYKKRSKESLKERANMKGGNFDTYIKPKFKQWKPKDGKNLIRILPPTWDPDEAPWQATEHYGLDIFINFNIGADNQAYLSLSKHGKGDDPIAEARREAAQEGEKDFAKKLQATQRILYWIIDRNDEDEGPLLWAAPFTFDKSLSNLCIDEDTKEVIFIDDPQKGRDVRFYKEGSGLNTKYDSSKMKVLGVSSVHEDEGIEEEWLEFITENPLPVVLNFYEYDHIKSSFDGHIGSFDDEDDDPKSNSSKGASKDKNEDNERPSRTSRRTTNSRDREDEVPKPSRRNAVLDENDPEERPSRRNSAKDETSRDESTSSRQRRRTTANVDPDEEPVRPSRRSQVQDPDDEDPDENPRSSRRGRTDSEDEDRGDSLREKLAARRRGRNQEED